MHLPITPAGDHVLLIDELKIEVPCHTTWECEPIKLLFDSLTKVFYSYVFTHIGLEKSHYSSPRCVEHLFFRGLSEFGRYKYIIIHDILCFALATGWGQAGL